MHMPIPTLVLHDYPAEKFGLVLSGCHDRSKGNYPLKKKCSVISKKHFH